MPIHGTPDRSKAGSRFYIHARNVASGVLFLLDHSMPSRSTWNIVGEREVNNLELAQMIAKMLDRSLCYEIVDFHSQRPGHDLRYGLDGRKLAKFGWTPPVGFSESLERHRALDDCAGE